MAGAKQPKEKKVEKAYAAFEYKGKRLDELEPVDADRTHAQTMRELNKRCRAMFDYCLENDLVMTDAHIALVLGISKKTLSAWRAGKQLGNGRPNSRFDKPTLEDTLYIKERAEALIKWRDMAEMRSCDKVSRSPNAQGSIYLTKASFGLYDTQQNTAASSGIHVENLILRAEQLKKAGLVPDEEKAAHLPKQH